MIIEPAFAVATARSMSQPPPRATQRQYRSVGRGVASASVALAFLDSQGEGGLGHRVLLVREGLHQLSGCAGDNLWKPEFGVGEVRDVVGNDGARPCGDRNFEHEVVAFVAEVRSPQVADIDFGCDGDKVRCGGELECEVGSSLLTAQPPCGCR